MSNFFRFIISKVFFINLLIALLLICGGVYATLMYLDDYTLHGKTIAVPDLVDKHIDNVDSLLAGGEFTKAISDSVYQKGVRGGKVLEQDPRAGYTVKQGRKIYLTIAAAEPPNIKMPDLVDLSLRQATSLMESYGLTVGELTYKPDLCSNCILEQKFNGEMIEAGDKVEKGAEIDLVVGQGLSNELTDVPYLIDFTAELAEELLKAKYLNVGSLNYDETVENEEDSLNAKVYKQIPFYSEEPSINMGGAVDLFLTIDTNRIVHTVNPSDSL